MLGRQTVSVHHCQGWGRGFQEADGPSQVTQDGRTLHICVGCPDGHRDSHRGCHWGCRDVSPHIPPRTLTAVCWDPLHLSRAPLPPHAVSDPRKQTRPKAELRLFLRS